jgi:hypothetical protein
MRMASFLQAFQPNFQRICHLQLRQHCATDTRDMTQTMFLANNSISYNGRSTVQVATLQPNQARSVVTTVPGARSDMNAVGRRIGGGATARTIEDDSRSKLRRSLLYGLISHKNAWVFSNLHAYCVQGRGWADAGRITPVFQCSMLSVSCCVYIPPAPQMEQVLQKLMVVQLAKKKKFPDIHGIQNFITVITTASCPFLSCARQT